MSIISVKNIEHTVAPHGGELLTQEWTYPRAIHAEIMTHRDKSRNAESSRAVPVLKKLEKTAVEPWVPKAFTRNKKGMQGGGLLDDAADQMAKLMWLTGFKIIKPIVETLANLEVHKQYANRLTEPWATITIVISGTEWENMDALRAHPDAMPEFEELMWMALDQRMLSRYKKLDGGRVWARTVEANELGPPALERAVDAWHLPYVGLDERVDLGLDLAIKCSVARCARVSFLNHDGTEPDVDKDIELYRKLLKSGHMSPFEHQGSPMESRAFSAGNFCGFYQYRKMIPGEVRSFNYWDACDKAGREPVVPRPNSAAP